MLLLFHERGNPFSRGWYKWGTLEEEGTGEGEEGTGEGEEGTGEGEEGTGEGEEGMGGEEEGTGVSVEPREEQGPFAELRTSMGFGRLWGTSMAY